MQSYEKAHEGNFHLLFITTQRASNHAWETTSLTSLQENE